MTAARHRIPGCVMIDRINPPMVGFAPSRSYRPPHVIAVRALQPTTADSRRDCHFFRSWTPGYLPIPSVAVCGVEFIPKFLVPVFDITATSAEPRVTGDAMGGPVVGDPPQCLPVATSCPPHVGMPTQGGGMVCVKCGAAL
jgi:hypothetical protein